MSPIRRAKVRTKKRHSVWPPWRVVWGPHTEVFVSGDPDSIKRLSAYLDEFDANARSER